MSLKSAPYYWVECDDCELSAEEGGDHSAWRQDWVAYDSATNADFIEVEREGESTLHYCPGCASKRGLYDNEEE